MLRFLRCSASLAVMSGDTLKVNVPFCFSESVLLGRLPKMSPKDATESRDELKPAKT